MEGSRTLAQTTMKPMRQWLHGLPSGFSLSLAFYSSGPFAKLTLLWATSERRIPDLAKIFLSADQTNLYFIQLFVLFWQFCGTY
jgi:hypothetical protein